MGQTIFPYLLSNQLSEVMLANTKATTFAQSNSLKPPNFHSSWVWYSFLDWSSANIYSYIFKPSIPLCIYHSVRMKYGSFQIQRAVLSCVIQAIRSSKGRDSHTGLASSKRSFLSDRTPTIRSQKATTTGKINNSREDDTATIKQSIEQTETRKDPIHIPPLTYKWT